MADELSDLLNEVLASPLGDVIASVGEGVAAAQEALDRGSLAKTLEIYREGGDELLRVMREIGYQPTFYALPETTGEVTVALRIAGATGRAPPPPAPVLNPAALAKARIAGAAGLNLRKLPTTYVTPVDASFQNRYNFSASASSRLTFRIVPVPAPAGAEALRVVPDLEKMLWSAARALLETLDIAVRTLDAQGAEIAAPDAALSVLRQEPEAGSVIGGGSVVELVLGEAEEEDDR